MFNRIMPTKYYCGLDIGSQTIKTALIEATDATNVELLGVFENKLFGLRDVSISDLGELSESIHHALDELSKHTGVKIKEVQLGISGSMVDIRESSTMIPLIDRGNKVIAKNDLKKVNNQARLLGLKIEEEVLHDLPICYQTDDTSAILNPMGLYAHKLGVRSLMILSKSNLLRNMTKAIQQAGYETGNVFFSSYVAAELGLNEQERIEGAAVIDIGSENTNILIFKDNSLKFLETIRMGGNNFTKCIAEKLNLPFDLAEEIKKSYAVASSAELYPEEEILVKRESQYMPIKRNTIYQSISSEINRLVEHVQGSIRSSGFSDSLNKGVVAVGGGVLLPGLIERIGESIQTPVRLGKISIKSRKPLTNSALYLPVVGLALNGMKTSLRHTFSSNGGGHWYQSMVNRVRELYQEYF